MEPSTWHQSWTTGIETSGDQMPAHPLLQQLDLLLTQMPLRGEALPLLHKRLPAHHDQLGINGRTVDV